jgi:hypothetical protein
MARLPKSRLGKLKGQGVDFKVIHESWAGPPAGPIQFASQ